MAKMMTSFAFSCLCHHRGVSGYAGTPWFPAVEAHTEHRALVQPDCGSIVPPPPDPEDLAGKYGVQAPAKDFEAMLLGRNPPDPLGLNQNTRWKDPLLATPVITPG